ncbi:MAPEG family protein [Halieaceae bacterium IMCC14734]|uniref:MAPEG family protein n=1 Tax=Candidatus Litorirhabdus singularis TaxID=2518993 RepID=A0ABT3TD54_9GAMM|nr:MAPEG family protein [Candidatus Litorirhabdus singularis]MCX2980231.1 MAPEG family protein [Candidatus Litorirhabdus singularis]
MDNAILTPALALITWSLVIWFLMYARRIPAMQAANIDPGDAKHPGSLDVLPSGARAAADNFNHLHEQPTIFYALVFYTLLAGNADGIAVNLAWAYVAIRVVHSLVQTTSNNVMLRFPLFAASSLVLVAMTVRNLLAL